MANTVNLRAVCLDYLGSPVVEIDDSLPGWLALRPQFQVRDPVVEPDSVTVVDAFAGAQRSTKVVDHNELVLKDEALRVRSGMSGAVQAAITGCRYRAVRIGAAKRCVSASVAGSPPAGVVRHTQAASFSGTITSFDAARLRAIDGDHWLGVAVRDRNVGADVAVVAPTVVVRTTPAACDCTPFAAIHGAGVQGQRTLSQLKVEVI